MTYDRCSWSTENVTRLFINNKYSCLFFVLNIRYKDIWKNRIRPDVNDDSEMEHGLNIESNAFAATVLTRNLNENEVRNSKIVTT